MTRALLRRLGATTAALAATAAVTTAVAPTASAASPPFSGSPAVVADFTGDGIADQLSLGVFTKASGDVCGYQFRPGVGKGRYGAATTARLPLGDTVAKGEDESCPDTSVLLKGPTPQQNRLALTWRQFGPSGGGPYIRIVGGFGTPYVDYLAGVAGVAETGAIGTQDFDGDGWGDIWESTDQGGGFVAYLGDDTSWHQLYASPFTLNPTEQFFDLNRAGGTDILVSWTDAGRGSGVAAVDGRTGAVQVIRSATDLTIFDASVVDLDHDAYPDLQVTEQGRATVHRYLNRSQGGRWYFQPLSTA